MLFPYSFCFSIVQKLVSSSRLMLLYFYLMSLMNIFLIMVDSKFSQQELPAWQPILTPGWVYLASNITWFNFTTKSYITMQHGKNICLEFEVFYCSNSVILFFCFPGHFDIFGYRIRLHPYRSCFIDCITAGNKIVYIQYIIWNEIWLVNKMIVYWTRNLMQVVEIELRYDHQCLPSSYKDNATAYIKDDRTDKTCIRKWTVSITISFLMMQLKMKFSPLLRQNLISPCLT